MSTEDAKSKLLYTYMPLRGGEVVLASLEGNAYSISPNIYLRILAFIMRIVSILVGRSRKIYLVVTNTRIITIETQKTLWVFDGSISARNYLPRSISMAGYFLRRDFLVFKSHYLEFSSSASSESILVKSQEGKKKVYEMIYKINMLAERVEKVTPKQIQEG